MIKLSCSHVALSEITGLRAIDEYEKMVRPLDYEFDLVRNAVYLTLGILTRLGTPWLYVASASGDKQLQLVPAVLFAFHWSKVPENWHVRLVGQEDIQLLPASLVAIEGWFEKYVNDEAVVVALVEEEIEKFRKVLKGSESIN